MKKQTDKFAKLFEQTNDKIGENGHIDFQKSDINKKTPHRTKKIQTHISDSEFDDFINTLKPLENRAERVRYLILKDIKNRQKKNNDDSMNL